MPARPAHPDHAIWLHAFGYFACYAPYSALTKLVSEGRIPGMTSGLSGFAILPISTMASCLGMYLFLTLRGWWQYAGRRTVLGRSLPMPGLYTFLSGLCSAAIIGTTTFAYTIRGASIVFMMLLMRGGVLAIAPVVDIISRRKVRLTSWLALVLSLGALLVAVTEGQGQGFTLTLVAGIDVAVYLLAYFIRLRFMSHLAKSDDPRDMLRYFVEEQMVATPAIVTFLALFAFLGGDAAPAIALRYGFTGLWSSAPALLSVVVIGVLSQGTGIYGGLILLDGRENTFCVPVNRASSVLAGILASLALGAFFGAPPVPAREFAGAGLVIAAIVVLAWPSPRPRPAHA
jgi:drug/metabolite transporter (DMT)-like permease